MTTNTWQDTLAQSTKKAEQGAKYKKQAGILLWDGAVAAITDYTADASSDPDAEKFSADVLAALGDGRKGDASKIKTVALAVVNRGLVLDQFPNLSKAYAEATRLTKTVKVHAAEDEAADAAVRNIVAPKTASAPEGAAKLVMAQGVDEAARLLLAALGNDQHAAHKAFVRAVVQEAAGLIPKPEPKAKAPAKPKGKAVKKATAPRRASEKADPASAAPAKAKPVKKAAPKPVESEPGDMFADLDDDLDTPEVEAAPVSKPKPVRRGPVRR